MTALKTLNGHTNNVLVVDQLANGNLVSGSDDNNVIIWNPTSGTQVSKFSPSAQSVGCVKQLSDGTLATGGNDASIYIWNITTTTPAKIFTLTNALSSETPCHDFLLYNSSMLAVASDGVNTELYNVANSKSVSHIKTLSLNANNALCLDSIGIE